MGGGGVAPIATQPGNFADGVVNSALRFRAQAPIVDQLLREIGIQGGGADIGEVVGAAMGATSAVPNAGAVPGIPVADPAKKA